MTQKKSTARAKKPQPVATPAPIVFVGPNTPQKNIEDMLMVEATASERVKHAPRKLVYVATAYVIEAAALAELRIYREGLTDPDDPARGPATLTDELKNLQKAAELFLATRTEYEPGGTLPPRSAQKVSPQARAIQALLNVVKPVVEEMKAHKCEDTKNREACGVGHGCGRARAGAGMIARQVRGSGLWRRTPENHDPEYQNALARWLLNECPDGKKVGFTTDKLARYVLQVAGWTAKEASDAIRAPT